MQMDAGLDTGPMLLREAIPIRPDDTSATLHDRLAPLGAEMILRALAESPPPVPQPREGATYAAKLSREDGRLVWTEDATVLERRVRAFDPWPGTFTMLGGKSLKVLAARIVDGTGTPGTVLDNMFTVACGRGALRLTRVQFPGGAAMPADAFLRGHPVPLGTVLGG
jgi:methionyl-tRNA formyltransferase